MKSIINVFVYVSCILSFSVACSKKDGANEFVISSSEITMSIDGKLWKSKAVLGTIPPARMDGNHFVVFISGHEVETTQNSIPDNSRGLFFWILIPKNKFNNPVGTYKVFGEENVDRGSAYAMYAMTIEDHIQIYSSSSAEKQSVGVIKIDDFKIGRQSKFTDYKGEDGYIQLSGSFEVKMQGGRYAAGGQFDTETLMIADGRFNLFNEAR